MASIPPVCGFRRTETCRCTSLRPPPAGLGRPRALHPLLDDVLAAWLRLQGARVELADHVGRPLAVARSEDPYPSLSDLEAPDRHADRRRQRSPLTIEYADVAVIVGVIHAGVARERPSAVLLPPAGLPHG